MHMYAVATATCQLSPLGLRSHWQYCTFPTLHLTCGLPVIAQHNTTSLHADTNGKLPYEVEAAAAAAAEEEKAARATALCDIPDASASWGEVCRLMEKANADIAARNMTEWLADGMLRGKQVERVIMSWIDKAAQTVEQKRIINDFYIEFKCACEGTS